MSGPTPLIRENCPVATTNNDGLMSKEQVADLAANVAYTKSGGATPNFGAEVVTRYCRSTGSDSTGDGLTPWTAYRTPEYALATIRLPLGAIAKIDMTDYGTYTPAAPWQMPFIIGSPNNNGRIRFVNSSAAEISAFGTNICYGDVLLYATPTTQLNIAGSTYSASVDTITGRVSYTVAGASWTVNQWAGMMLVSGTGTSTGLYRIVSNTGNTLVVTLASPFFVPVGTTAAMRIQSESCTVDLSVAGYWFYGGTRRRNDSFNLSMAGIAVTGGFYTFFQAGFMGLNLIGCSLPYGDTTTVGNTTIYGCHILETDPGSNYVSAYAPRTDIQQSLIRDTWMIDNARGSLVGFGLDLERINGFGDGIYHGTTGLMPAVALVTLSNSEVRDSVGAFRGLNEGWRGIVGFCRFTSCSYGGIRMERGAWCTVNGYLAGSGNGAAAGGAGMTAIDNSQIFIQQTAELTNVALDASNCSIGGTGGDLAVGALSYRSMTSFFGNAPIKIESDYTRGGARVYQRSTENQPANVVSALPTASSSYRGIVLTVLGSGGVADVPYICLKKADGTYDWFECTTV